MGKIVRHEVTDNTKKQVEALVSFGISHVDVANYMGISHDTLTRRYKKELDNGLTKAVAKVASVLFYKATVEKDLTAVIFFLKTRGRWREKDREDDAVKDSLVQKLIDKL